MKVLMINGSPRVNGNTSIALKEMEQIFVQNGIESEIVQIGNKDIRGCIACGQCRAKNLGRCIFDDDPVNEWIDAMHVSDGIILASPTYFATITTEMKALIDRGGFSAGNRLYRKVGAPVTVARRGGAIQTYNTLMAFFGINQMVVPMSSYWNMGYGREAGEVENDAEALQTMRNLGSNMAWLLQKLHHSNI